MEVCLEETVEQDLSLMGTECPIPSQRCEEIGLKELARA